MKKLLLLPLLVASLFGENMVVKITKDIPYVYTTDSGKRVKVERIQDVNNRLTDDYSKTSRPCPPFCVQPTHVYPDIKNFEELELLKFMQDEVAIGKGLVIDARLKSWFELETIPSAINLPFPIIQNASKEKAKKIFMLLGMTVDPNGTWNFSKVKDLAIFDNGVWCRQAYHLISGLLKHHYPKSQIHYYRSGFQGWKLIGLTTIVHKEIKKD